MPLRSGRHERVEPGPGQESVWDYPRPPLLVRSSRLVEIRVGDTLLATTSDAYRVLETSHPPTWYLPPNAFHDGVLKPAGGRGSICEWKGAAVYWDVVLPDGGVLPSEAWSYPRPSSTFVPITDHVAVYARTLTCVVDGERVRPQPGGFYGGWVTDDVVGPFKGAPGTMGW
ncbi:hypothetical protein C8046_02990 [Serinibacter arcticus]|uniref:DUF427 domain-containing protein n=1 Tax=Serinibacter arcticus TaxID=1655435 RepID=A0A2U1ZSA0_9MICO|nr:DUF427 domain-containing protein [Serinibacter arcticus]PWD49813.1 hypothetical protein C8046_02990 [Serinibacter arcticus]